MALLCLFLLCQVVSHALGQKDKPHIVFIVADDLGWNDVGFHGSSQIPTPNIDALAYSGIILNKYYVTPICTPSRSALMTGKYPIHTGMQHSVLYGSEPRGLPLEEKLLPQYLKELGYRTHLVGKWHLGSWKKEYTPTFRGFETHFGYWTGHQDYNDHTAVENQMWGFDLRRGLDPAVEYHGRYSTDLFTDEAVQIIEEHNTSEPLFLYLAHAAVHSGNPYNPLAAPDALISSFRNITDYYRKRFAGMMTKLDESVGKVVEQLERKGMLKNSIIVFTTDNGGPAEGFNLNAASNWPLRGVKNTLWEGGVRGVGVVWSRYLRNMSRVSNQTMHITDWLPTLVSAAGGNAENIDGIDGIDLWESLSENTPSNRSEVLHNIDDIWGSSALTIGDWKVVNGTNYQREWDGWYGPSGREDENNYDAWSIIHSPAGRSLSWYGKSLNQHAIKILRKQSEVKCFFDSSFTECDPLLSPCLFNVIDDPCEFNNVAKEYPLKLKELLDKLAEYNSTAVPPGNLPLDPKGDPKLWNNMWTNFGDYETNYIF
ncbi:arylsulfatase B [Halyomorpha halys]|uniref:arylsulfatase B n=1 Tax=Halyomorpha halys TaxID=286706 RepID=UPI0006D4EAFF|nr:arylsulfatase B-like [Halyomorpha halys]